MRDLFANSAIRFIRNIIRDRIAFGERAAIAYYVTAFVKVAHWQDGEKETL
jgi:hypothetical protein